jgi:hypothetical protein
MITSRSDRTPFLFLAELFELINGPSAKLVRFESKDDYMGGLKARMELAGDVARLAFDYEQSIDDEWQHVDRRVFSPAFESKGSVGLTFDIDLSGSGEVEFTLHNAELDLVEKAMRLAAECFAETELGPGLADDLRMKTLIAQAAWEKRRLQKSDGQKVGAAPRGSGVERLAQALDRERDAYMEWHDGPDFSDVDEAVGSLDEAELKTAGEFIAARLEAGYHVHLGRAAVLLGRRGDRLPQMVTALEQALRREKQTHLRVRLAGDVLKLVGSVPASMALRQAIEGGAGWSDKVEAICQLKELLECRLPERPLRELMPPETASVLMTEVAADDYLVRYHAADSLLKAAGFEEGVTKDKELFGLICGKHREGREAPDQEERKRFIKAAACIHTLLKNRGII